MSDSKKKNYKELSYKELVAKRDELKKEMRPVITILTLETLHWLQWNQLGWMPE